MIASPASRERLEALGIDVWVRRDRRVGAPAMEREIAEATSASKADPAGENTAPRVRMASGDGDWLLVRDGPWDGRHDVLLGDIQAAIGSARCRFGQWAHSDSAGVALDELDSRGVRHVLVFGPAPEAAGQYGVLLGPELSALADSAEAKRRLWRLLAAELAD